MSPVCFLLQAPTAQHAIVHELHVWLKLGLGYFWVQEVTLNTQQGNDAQPCTAMLVAACGRRHAIMRALPDKLLLKRLSATKFGTLYPLVAR